MCNLDFGFSKPNSYKLLMKSIGAKKPLCYQLDGSHRVTSLPYIDEERPELKTKILYLIRS